MNLRMLDKIKKSAGRVSLALTVIGVALFAAMPAWAQTPDPETIAVDTATSLKDSLLNVFSGVAPVALLVMVAVFGITFGVKLVRRFAK